MGVERLGESFTTGEAFTVGERTVPLDWRSRQVVNAYGPTGTFETVSLADLLSRELAPDRFRGRIVHPQHWSDDIEVAGKRVVFLVDISGSMAKKDAETADPSTMCSPGYPQTRCQGSTTPLAGSSLMTAPPR